MTQTSLFDLPLTTPGVLRARDRAMQSAAQHAEDHRPNFLEDARAFVLRYLEQHGPTSGEVLTMKCKEAGIKAHDDRAFGPVLYVLARRGLIRKAGECRRQRGHGTSGGNIWARK